jgi:hypothetical protein
MLVHVLEMLAQFDRIQHNLPLDTLRDLIATLRKIVSKSPTRACILQYQPLE